MERNDRIHPSDPEPDETRDDPIFPDDIKHDGVEDTEDDIGNGRFNETRP
jgi:hypothetical protein